MLTAKQLEKRKALIGSSDAPAVAGTSPFTTPAGIYLRKIAPANVFTDEPDDAMLLGSLIEPVIAKEYFRREGITARKGRTAKCKDKDAQWMGSTTDYENENEIFEVKCVTHKWEDWRGNAVPQHVIDQIQWQMYTRKKFKARVVRLLGTDISGFKFEYDPNRLKMLFDMAKFFKFEILDKRNPDLMKPESGTEYARMLLINAPGNRTDVLTAPAELEEIIYDAVDEKADIEELQTKLDLKLNTIRQMMGDYTKTVDAEQGNALATFSKATEREQVDWEKVARDVSATIPQGGKVLAEMVRMHTNTKLSSRTLRLWAKAVEGYEAK